MNNNDFDGFAAEYKRRLAERADMLEKAHKRIGELEDKDRRNLTAINRDGELVEGLKAELAALRSANQWRPASEPPEIGKRVLISWKSTSTIGSYNPRIGGWWVLNGMLESICVGIEEIDGWRELPTPEESNGKGNQRRTADAGKRGGVMNKFSTIGWMVGSGYAEKKTKKYIAVVWEIYHGKWKWKIYERTILDNRGAEISRGSRKVRWECLRLAETQLKEISQ